MSDTELKVTEGGLKIEDFDDLKIAFLELLEKHNQLAMAFEGYRNRNKTFLNHNRPYGS